MGPCVTYMVWSSLGMRRPPALRSIKKNDEQKKPHMDRADPTHPHFTFLSPHTPHPHPHTQFRAKLLCVTLTLVLLGSSSSNSASFLRPVAAAPPALVSVLSAAQAADKPAPANKAAPAALDTDSSPVLYNVNPDGSKCIQRT